MSVSLVKGQKVNLQKEDGTNLNKVVVGLGWDVNKYDGQADFDLDASAFLLNVNGKVRNDKDIIFYGNLKSLDESVEHTGDNLTGEGEGDDEQIKIDLSKVPADVEAIAITVTIYDAVNRKQTFGQVSNAFARIVDQDSNNEVIRYDLGEDYSTETALVVAKIYRHNGNWKIEAVGSGYNNGLGGLGKDFGVNILPSYTPDK